MRAHVIENGIVVNTILVDNLNVLPNLLDASMGGNIGDSWDKNIFSPARINDEVLNQRIKDQIISIEEKQNRIVREAILGISGAIDELTSINNEIIEVRKKLR